MWFNVVKYTPAQLALFAVAAMFWILAYILIIRNIRKYKYVGVPIAAVCTNFAWETLWSTAFYSDMGDAFEWGYRAWFFLDIFIFIGILQYGHKQLPDNTMLPYFQPTVILGWLGWMGAIYTFTVQYAPDHIGANSAYVVNTQMSFLYIVLILRQPHEPALQTPVIAWFKMLGTLLTTIFCFWCYPQSIFMLYLGVISFVLDMIYIVLVHRAMGKRA